MPSGGDCNTPCQTATKSLTDMTAAATHVSARVLFDLSDLPHKSFVSMPLGTCEVAGSPHVGDTTSTWHSGEFHPIRWDLEDVRANTKYATTFF